MSSRRTKNLKVDEKVVDYNKNINFETPGMERPKTTDEVKNYENRVKLFNYIYKIMSREADYDDVYQLAYHLVYKMGFFQAIPKNLLIDRSSFLSEEIEHLGFYHSLTDTIYLSLDLLDDVASGKKSIFELFNTISHECQHVLQKTEIENINSLDDKSKEHLSDYAKKVILDYGKHVLSEKELDNIVLLIGSVSDNKEFAKINAMDQSAKYDYLQTISFSQYLQFSHETDARHAGIRFSIDIYDKLMKDNLCSNEMKNWIDSQKDAINTFINEEKIYSNSNKSYSDFKKNVETLAFDEIMELAKNLGELNKKNYNFDHLIEEDKHKIGLAVNTVYFQILQLYLENKNTEQINDILSLCLKKEDVPIDSLSFYEQIFTVCSNNKNIDKDLISKNVYNIIVDKSINPKFLFSSALLLLGQQNFESMFNTLLAQNRTQDIFSVSRFLLHKYSVETAKSQLFDDLSNLFDENVEFSSKNMDDFMKKMLVKTIDYSNNFISKLNSGNLDDITRKDIVSIKNFWNIIGDFIGNAPDSFKASIEEYSQLFGESLNEKLYNDSLEKIKKRDSDREITEKKYGPNRAKNIKSETDRIKDIESFLDSPDETTDLTVYDPFLK